MQIRWFFPCALFVMSISLVACSVNSDGPLTVRQFHLRNTELAKLDARMVRGEQSYRMKGAVTLEERRERLGHYYTVIWNSSAGHPDRVVMEYQQMATGSEVKQMVHELPLKKRDGKVEFKITGDMYRQDGRVLAWRVLLMSGKRVLAEKRSYLWR